MPPFRDTLYEFLFGTEKAQSVVCGGEDGEEVGGGGGDGEEVEGQEGGVEYFSPIRLFFLMSSWKAMVEWAIKVEKY